MNTTIFVKHHRDPARGLAARRHRDWLADLNSGVRIPGAHAGSATVQILERLHGRQPGPNDLTILATALGQLHGIAHQRQLHAARLDQSYPGRPELVITDFRTRREHLIDRYGLDLRRPAAIYKDANIRNFLLTADGPALVDFDDLTLAPFGYDLAKLVVSTAMTHGHLDADHLLDGLRAYTEAVAASGGPEHSCSDHELAVYAEIHHELTARYLHRNGYQHSWADVRPWTTPHSARL